MKNQTDFSSMISVRAVTAGIMASLCFMFLSLALIAALGIWNYNLNELTTLGPAFWISVTISWALSLYFAGLISALASRSRGTMEGALNALAACCGSYLFFGMIFLFFAPNALDSLLAIATPQFFLRVFLGDVFAFAVGIYGGTVGAQVERHTEVTYRNEKKITNYST